MDRHIRKYLRIVAIFSFVITFIASSIIYFVDYNDSQYKTLSTFSSVIEQELSNKVDKFEYITELSGRFKGLRIRYISGTKNYDSAKSENFSLEVGENTNHVDMAKTEYELVRKLEDGSLLGVSTVKSSLLGVLIHLVPINFLAFGCVFILTKFVTKRAVTKVMNPINAYEKTENLEALKDAPEIYPLEKLFNRLNDAKVREINEVERQRDTINTILGGMKEGLLILDEKRRILMLNSEAAKILETDQDSVSKSILYVTRNSEIVKAIENCYMGVYSEGRMECQDRYIKYYSNPVYYEGKINGAVLLLIDETKRIEAEKVREEFSANVSHELRTPLTSIYGFAELLNAGMITDDKDRKEIYDRIYGESKRLLSLIDEIIKISKLESNVQVAEDRVDLKELEQRLREYFEQIASEKSVELKISGDGIFKSNMTMVWEMLANLIENSIKYNVEDGVVDVEMKVGRAVEFIVKDSGIGIDEESLKRIFERFYRVDKSRNKKSGGTGLGLSIVKHIVKNLDGDIEVQSEVGVGTTIKIILPKTE